MFDWTNPNVDLFGNAINTGNSGVSPTIYDANPPSWVDSVTGLLGGITNAYSTVQQANAINHPQTAPNGMQYVNGQFSAGAGSMSPLILLAGAGLVLFLFLKD
jgi:hypothetical protein